MNRYLSFALIALALAAGTRAYGHHSFAATYNEGQKKTIEGEIVQFLWRNPHSFVHMIAKDDSGKPQRWAIEWGAGGQLGNQGVARDTLKPGDHVVVTGDISRTPGDFRLRMRTILRPSDGWRWGGEFD